MSLEGLQAILDKKEVVPTVSAEDLRDRPLIVEQDYLYHVRTYLHMSQAAVVEGQLSVDDFEKRLIKQVKEGKVPRGYITAGYGYGKTSTALYLWKRAQESNLVIIPPFTLSQLPDLLTAVYGWVRYKVNAVRPGLLSDLDELYESTVNRSLESVAAKFGLTVENAEKMWQQKSLVLDLQPYHYIEFFERATKVVLEAGYEGLVVMPDEIQQYFRPKSREGGEPVAPFFNIVQLLNGRAAGGDWRFGFILVITLEELSQIRDTYRRSDLLHRMKDLQIDLTMLYDHNFAPTLWQKMAQQFDFKREVSQIADDAALLSLGEISARREISDGPRTVINVFRRMVRRYLEAEGRVAPYTPIDLITDFLDEQTISFAGNDKIREVVRRALNSDIVRQYSERYSPAIKLAAAFPTRGASKAIQQQYQQFEALAELRQRAIGDLVRSPLLGDEAITLVGLADEQQRTKWLPATVREFRLGYNEHARIAQERAEETFVTLLQEKIFTRGKWKVINEHDRNFVVNRGIIFEGAFDAHKSRYPVRRVHVRLLWEDEAVKDSHIEGDICLEYRLSLYGHISSPEDRRQASDEVQSTELHTARFTLNLLYIEPQHLSAGIQKQLEDVWSPYDLSPLVLSNIYTLVEEKRKEGQIPKNDDALIQNGFQPEILDTLLRTLFNEGVGAPSLAPEALSGKAITETVVGYMLADRYPNYSPLVTVQNWRTSITKYTTALRLLELPGQRQGQIDVEGKKDDIVKLFGGLSNTGFDSFQSTFNTLLQIVKDFRGTADGVIRFTLHPLEKQIMLWLKESQDKQTVTKNGRTSEVKRLNTAKLSREALNMGYLQDEIKAFLEILQDRGLAEDKDGWLVELITDVPQLDDVRQRWRDLERDLGALAAGFEDDALLQKWQQEMNHTLKPRFTALMTQKAPSPDDILKLDRTLQTRHGDMAKLIEGKRADLYKHLPDVKRLATFPIAEWETLSKPINQVVEYADQVNAMRNALVQEGSATRKKIEEHDRDLRTVSETLSRPSLGYEELIHYHRAMPDYHQKAQDLQRLAGSFQSALRDFDRWRQLVTKGETLQRDLEQEDPKEVASLKDDFATLSMDIRAEISSQGSARTKALTLYAPFIVRLDDMLSALTTMKQQRRTEFQAFQQHYKDALKDFSAYGKRAWQDEPYNPSNPSGVQQRVLDNTRQVLQVALTEAKRSIMNTQQALGTIDSQMVNLPVEQRSALTAEIQDVMPMLEMLLETWEELEKQANDYKVLSIPDQFHSFCQQASLLIRDVMAQASQVQTVRQRVGAIKPTEAEESLIALLKSIKHDDQGLDLVEIKSRWSHEGDFWKVLQGLYDKNYLRLIVQLKDLS